MSSSASSSSSSSYVLQLASGGASAAVWGDEGFGGSSSSGSSAYAQLPPPTEEGPDEEGIKTTTSYRRTDKGAVEKVVRRVKVVTTFTRIPKGVIERKASMVNNKFGAARGENEGTTYPSNEDIRIEKQGQAPDKSGLEALVQQGGVSGWGGGGAERAGPLCWAAAAFAEQGLAGCSCTLAPWLSAGSSLSLSLCSSLSLTHLSSPFPPLPNPPRLSLSLSLPPTHTVPCLM
jgi:hypothetical protein